MIAIMLSQQNIPTSYVFRTVEPKSCIVLSKTMLKEGYYTVSGIQKLISTPSF